MILVAWNKFSRKDHGFLMDTFQSNLVQIKTKQNKKEKSKRKTGPAKRGDWVILCLLVLSSQDSSVTIFRFSTCLPGFLFYQLLKFLWQFYRLCVYLFSSISTFLFLLSVLFLMLLLLISLHRDMSVINSMLCLKVSF